MRRRRPHLQVSLFPFLSVLLCTLGALVLLLLVLDQKSREQRQAEARWQEAERAAQIGAAAQELAERADQAERRLTALRASRDDLAQTLQGLLTQEQTQLQAMSQQHSTTQELQAGLDAESRRLAVLQRSVQDKKQNTQALQDRRTMAEAESNRLREQMRQLERGVRLVQEASRRKSTPVYSLQPYKGTHGTGRQPVFVECVGTQVVFRPGNDSLWQADLLEESRFQREVIVRFAQLQMDNESTQPYVLLLIRPSGIGTYYKALAALQGATIDLGYELIDEDWALDFSKPSPSAGVAAQDQTQGSQALGSGRGGPDPSPWRGPGIGAGGGGTLPGLRPPVVPGSLGTPALGNGLVPTMPRSRAKTTDLTQGPPTEKLTEDKPHAQAAEKAKPGEGAPKPSGGGSKTAASDQPGSGRGPGDTSGQRSSGPEPVGRGTNDWTITLECSAAGVTLESGKHVVSLAELAETSNPLLKELRAMIRDRQKYQPGVRPRLKYLIHADGLRTYYLAAGALESLKLPTDWELRREPKTPATGGR